MGTLTGHCIDLLLLEGDMLHLFLNNSSIPVDVSDRLVLHNQLENRYPQTNNPCIRL